MQAQCTEPVVIIGAGEFGTALYTELQAFNVDVRLFCLDPEKASPDGPFYLAEHEDILSWENLTERVASAVPELCPEDAAKCRYVLAIGASGVSEEKYKSVVAAFQSAAGNTSKVQRDIHIRASSDPRHKRPGSFDVDEKGADAFIRSAFQTKDARWLGDDLFVAQRKVLKGLAENTLADTPILKDNRLQILSRNSNAEPVEGTTKLQQDETVHVVGSPAALDAVFRSADERRTREQRRGVIIPVLLFPSIVLISAIFSLVGMSEREVFSQLSFVFLVTVVAVFLLRFLVIRVIAPYEELVEIADSYLKLIGAASLRDQQKDQREDQTIRTALVQAHKQRLVQLIETTHADETSVAPSAHAEESSGLGTAYAREQ